MGIFSSFFGTPPGSGPSKQPAANAAQAQPVPEQKETVDPAFPALTRNMTINVFLADGRPLLSGKITSFRDGVLTLERNTGQLSFSVCPAGEEVRLRGLTNTGIPYELKGAVRESTRILCVICELNVVTHEELRSNFRLPVRTAVSFYYEDDRRLENPEECQLVNISVGGACVESEYIHGEGEVLRLKVKLEEYTPMVFLGEIIRVEEPSPGLFRYGFLFAQLEEAETEALTKMLFNVQVGNKRERTRGASHGAWT